MSVVRHVETTAQHTCLDSLDTSNVSRHDEPSGIWPYTDLTCVKMTGRNFFNLIISMASAVAREWERLQHDVDRVASEDVRTAVVSGVSESQPLSTVCFLRA